MIQVLVGLLGVFLALAAPSAPTPSAMFRGDARHTGVFASAAGPALSSLRWQVDAHGPVRGSPTVLGDASAVLFGSGDGHLYCVDAANGRERWHTALGGAVVSTPAVSGDLVVGTARERTVTAVDLATGRVRWRFEAGKDLPFDWEWDYWLSSPAIAENRVFVGSGDGELYALELSSGRRLWELSTGG